MIEGRTSISNSAHSGRRTGNLEQTADRFLAVSVVLFILALYLVSALPGLSRIVHLSVGMILASLLLRSLATPLRIRLEPVMLVGAVFVSYALASVWWASDQGAALVSAIGLLVDSLAAFLIWLALQNGLNVRIVAICAAIGASVQGIVALNQYFVGGESRAVGLVGNANSLALQLSMSAFLLLLCVPRERWAKILPLILIVVATITTGTRKLIFVWFSYLMLLLRSVSPLFRRPTLPAALVLIISPLALWLLFTYSSVVFTPLGELTVVQRAEGTLQGRETDTRSHLIQRGLELWWERPITGHGIDQFRHVSEYTYYSHNNYTEILSNFGVIGFALFYSLYALLLIRAVPAALRGSDTAWTILAIVVLLLLMDVARVSYTSRMTWLTIGLMSYYSVARASARNEPTGST